MEFTVSIDKKEVLRYLGYHGTAIPESLDLLIDHCIKKTLLIISPKYLIRQFNLIKIDNGISLENTRILLAGEDISRHLAHCKKAVLLCATVGLDIEKLIRQKMITSPDEGVIFDSCATTAIESLADMAEKIVIEDSAKEGLKTTWRFSAGYGDLPLETQKPIITEMDTARKIGLSLTSGMLLTPSKSVTAIIGLGQISRISGKTSCGNCVNCKNRNSCEFSRGKA